MLKNNVGQIESWQPAPRGVTGGAGAGWGAVGEVGAVGLVGADDDEGDGDLLGEGTLVGEGAGLIPGAGAGAGDTTLSAAVVSVYHVYILDSVTSKSRLQLERFPRSIDRSGDRMYWLRSLQSCAVSSGLG